MMASFDDQYPSIKCVWIMVADVNDVCDDRSITVQSNYHNHHNLVKMNFVVEKRPAWTPGMDFPSS
jgi:hypothetical protein